MGCAPALSALLAATFWIALLLSPACQVPRDEVPPPRAPVRTSVASGETLHGFEAYTLEWDAPAPGVRARVPYRLRRPAGEPGPEGWPLLVFLHGAGERGLDNERQLIHMARRFEDPAFTGRFRGIVLAPQCPPEQRWVEASWNALPPPAMEDAPSPAMIEAIALVEHTMACEPVDPSRVYLTGLSMGSQGAWELAVRRPELFAACAPICGGGDPSKVGAMRDVPTWAFHGVDDRTVPIERSQVMVEALRAAGGDVRFEILPEGTGHAAWNAAYSAESPLWPWFAGQQRAGQQRAGQQRAGQR